MQPPARLTQTAAIAAAVLLVATALPSRVNAAADVIASFAQDNLVPDIVDAAPTTSLDVRWPSTGAEATLGNELTIEQVAAEPTLEYLGDPKALYTIINIDPDAPSRGEPKLRSYLHWLVVNVKGDRLASGHVAASYRGAGAPPRTNLHRYVFLVYKQAAPIDVPLDFEAREKRPNFDVRAFANEHKLGRAAFGQYYQAKNAEQ